MYVHLYVCMCVRALHECAAVLHDLRRYVCMYTCVYMYMCVYTYACIHKVAWLYMHV